MSWQMMQINKFSICLNENIQHGNWDADFDIVHSAGDEEWTTPEIKIYFNSKSPKSLQILLNISEIFEIITKITLEITSICCLEPINAGKSQKKGRENIKWKALKTKRSFEYSKRQFIWKSSGIVCNNFAEITEII